MFVSCSYPELLPLLSSHLEVCFPNLFCLHCLEHAERMCPNMWRIVGLTLRAIYCLVRDQSFHSLQSLPALTNTQLQPILSSTVRNNAVNAGPADLHLINNSQTLTNLTIIQYFCLSPPSPACIIPLSLIEPLR